MIYENRYYVPKEIDPETFVNIVTDFKVMVPILYHMGIKLTKDGSGMPIVSDNIVQFNGIRNCGHSQESKIGKICQGDCHGDHFAFAQRLELLFPYESKEKQADIDLFYGYNRLSNGFYRVAVQTNKKPYGFAAKIFLIIAKHYLQKNIMITSDYKNTHWQKAREICQHFLRFGEDFQLFNGDIFTDFELLSHDERKQKMRTWQFARAGIVDGSK